MYSRRNGLELGLCRVLAPESEILPLPGATEEEPIFWTPFSPYTHPCCSDLPL